MYDTEYNRRIGIVEDDQWLLEAAHEAPVLMENAVENTQPIIDVLIQNNRVREAYENLFTDWRFNRNAATYYMVDELPAPPIVPQTEPRNLTEMDLRGVYGADRNRGYPCVICDRMINLGELTRPNNTANGLGLTRVHEDCFQTKFRCQSCFGPAIEKTEQTLRIWRVWDVVTRSLHDQEICVNCDARNSGNCVTCDAHTGRGHLRRVLTRQPDGENRRLPGYYCLACCSACHRCGDSFLLDQMRGNLEEGLYCTPCSRYGLVIRAHDYDPMQTLTFKGNPKNRLFYGVELEVEATEGNNNADVAEKILEAVDDFAVIKHDGSLVNGFEVVTCPASLEEHLGFWNKYFDLDLPLESYDSPRCGMHVHMSREAIPPMHLARMMVFMYSPNNRRLIEQIAGRNLHAGWGERYAEITSAKRITDIAGVLGGPTNSKQRGGRYEDYRNPRTRRWEERMIPTEPLPVKDRKIFKKNTERYGRYTALNDANDATVEIRIFRGCNKRTTVFKNLEFCQALFDYCRPGNTSLRLLETPSAFSYFVQKHAFEYRYLVKFMTKHNLI